MVPCGGASSTDPASSMPERIRSIVDWILEPQVRDLDDAWFFTRLCKRLADAGVPMWRAGVSVRTAHHEVPARELVWKREGGTDVQLQPVGDVAVTRDEQRPERMLNEGRESIRCRLDVPPDSIHYAGCLDLAAAGGTDYVVYRLPMSRGSDSYVWWASDRKGGFADAELDLFHGLIPVLSLRIELSAGYHAVDGLLEAYLGRKAAQRVRDGEFRRGRGESMAAVLWMCDLRGFRAMVDTQPMAKVLRLLDAYLECVGEPILYHGGEILELLGDAVLAAFPVSGDEAPNTCARALAAARQAFGAAAELNAERLKTGGTPLAFGIALHVGVFTRGNIAAGDRLVFSFLGPAVNEVWRVEGMCRQLATPLLLTEAFVRSHGEKGMASLGRFPLGDQGKVELYTIEAFARRR
jgi:adenylate cyclase